MATQISWSLFLRRVLLTDSISSGVSGIGLVLGSDTVQALLGVPAPAARTVGLLFVAFAAFVFSLSRMENPHRRGVFTVIGLNWAWVFASVLLLFTDMLKPSGLIVTSVLLQAAVVAAFAELEYLGLRKARSREPRLTASTEWV